MNDIEVAIKSAKRLRLAVSWCTQAATAQMMDEGRSRGHDFELLAKPVHSVQLLGKVKSLIGAPNDATALRLNSLA